MQTITKMTLVESLKKSLPLVPEVECEFITHTLYEVIKSALWQRNIVYIPKVCKITPSIKEPRPVRLIKTGESFVMKHIHSFTTGTNKVSNIESGKLTKIALINQIAEAASTSKYNAEVAANVFYKAVALVKKGEHRIELRGLGVFYPRYYASKQLNNINTGKPQQKEPSIGVAFRISPALRKAIDKEYLP